MILVGNQRGGGKDLANHLMKEENERVTVHDVQGFVSSDLHGAFQESYAISRATNCKQHLYSLSLNPPKGKSVSVAEFEDAIARAEDRLNLTGQPRAIVFHEKVGADGQLRRHAHAVWCRIDTEDMKAVQMSYDHRKLNDVSRELYLKHDWTMPKGLVKSEWKDPSTYSLAEWQQAKRAERDPKEAKIMFQDAWAISDSKAAFQAALKERGLILARGDRRGYVALDHKGEVYAIAKWTGQKTKDVKARLGDAEALPSVREAHQQAAKIVRDRLNALSNEQRHQAARDQERLDALKARQNTQHKEETTMQDILHNLRQDRETKERDARVRKGFVGLIDRITGKRRKVEAENRDAELKGIAGVAFIMGPDALTNFNPSNLAQLAILGATLSYAFAGVWGKTALAGQPPLMNALGMLVGSTVLMVPIVLLFDGPPNLALSISVWGALIGMAALSTALAYVLYFAILVRAGAANLLLVTLLIPPFAIGLGVIFLGEQMGLEAWIGFAIIGLGFAVTDGRLFQFLFRPKAKISS